MTPIKVALSAMWSRQAEMREVAAWLISLGYSVVSSWIQVDNDDNTFAVEAPEWASSDLLDVLACDVLVAFAEKPGTFGAGRGGRHVELGAALSTGKAVVLVGRPEHVFHRHTRVVRVDNKREMATALLTFARERREQMERDANNGGRA